MDVSLQDFFSPDPNAANRQLKRFLEEEGIALGYREVVALRGLARKGILLSYALLESLAHGANSDVLLEALESLGGPEAAPSSDRQDAGFATLRHRSGVLLAGLPDEFPVPTSSKAQTASRPPELPDTERVGESLTLSVSAPGAVLGPSGFMVGGSWSEEALHRDSVTLLDGEDEVALVEAFRRLYRAGPDPASKTKVLATALKRRKRALSSEVADKLQELSVPLGRSLRQLLCGRAFEERARALRYLLEREGHPEPEPWVEFWCRLRTPVLETLAREPEGSALLLDSVVELQKAATVSPAAPLTPPLVEALFSRPEQLSPEESKAVIGLLLLSLERASESVRLLENRLELSERLAERLLIGETLRLYFERSGASEPLRKLMARFAREALHVGNTASSLALNELLVAFGEKLLDLDSLTQLQGLAPRQLLRVLELWDHLSRELPETRARIDQLFLAALENDEVDRGLLLKSSLLERNEHLLALDEWCSRATPEARRELFLASSTWTLTTPNRERLAGVLRGRDWFAEELWRQEWRRANLSFQRLGWLAQCTIAPATEKGPSREPEWTEAMEQRLLEVLEGTPRNLYFWNLMSRLAGMGCWSARLVQNCVAAAARVATDGETALDDERPALVQAAASALGSHRDAAELQADWVAQLARPIDIDLLWQFELIAAVFTLPRPDLRAEPSLPAAILRNLFQGGRLSMERVLAHALTGAQEEDPRPRLSLEELNRGLEALATIAEHPGTSPDLQVTLRRRLAMFLRSWAEQLSSSTDLYAFRSTPLFALLTPLVRTEPSPLQELLDEAVSALWDLQRQQPEKLRIDVRQSAQDFLRQWLELRDPVRSPSAAVWQRTLDDLQAKSPGAA